MKTLESYLVQSILISIAFIVPFIKLSTVAFAQPKLFTQCETLDIPSSIRTEYNGGHFDEDCSQFYFFPPLSAKVSVIATSFPFENVCTRYKTASTLEQESLARYRKKLNAERIKCENIETTVEMLRSDLRDENLKKISLERRMSELALSLENCAAGVNNQFQEALCNLLPSKVTAISAEIRSNRSIIELISDDLKSDKEVAESCQISDIYSASNQEIEAIKRELELYSEWSSLVDGATASVTISMEQQKLIEALKQANPEINFAPMPVQGSFSLAVTNPTKPGNRIPALESISFPGFPAKALRNNPIYNSGAKLDQSYPTIDPVFAGSLGGKLALSFPASCELSFQDKEDLKNAIASHTQGTFTYFYPITAAASFSAEVNMRSLVEHIIENSSKGGLFRTRSSRKESHSAFAEEFVKITDMPELPGIIQEEIKDAIRNRAITRALELMGAKFSNVEFSENLPETQTNGARVAADEINRSKCKAIWCRASVAILNISSAIFSKTTSRQEFLSSIEIKVVDTVDASKVFILFGTSSISMATE